MSQFPIGFWNYTSINRQDAAAVKDWAGAGMTLTLGPNFGPDPAQISKMRSILDAAQVAGIRLILCHEQGAWTHLTKAGEEAYRRDFKVAVEAIGNHSAVFGFHVGDEPGTAVFSDACRAMRIQKEIAPHLQPFLNLFPMFQGVSSLIGYQDQARYLNDFATQAKPPFLCYDCYSQMNPDPEKDASSGYEMYFHNLRTFWQAAVRNNMDYWTTLLSVGHFRYRCPNEDDLRWQLNSAVASGAKGLLWFFFYMNKPQDNYRVAPIDEHGERTETYAWLSRVCCTFLKWQAPILLESTLIHSSHTGKNWGGWPLFDGSGLVAKASSSAGTGLIISEFKHRNGADYLAVVNNSQRECTAADLIVQGEKPNLHRVGWEATETSLVDSTGRGAEQGADYIKLQRWLAPGQMELFRVENGRTRPL